MIEIAPEEHQIICIYEEAVLYCFQLNIDGKNRVGMPYRKMKERM
jgi:hypothetical protein